MIKIKLEMFELQKDDGCLSDFLRVTDGPNGNPRTIARLCGTKTGKVLKSTGNNMWLHFRSNGSREMKGFEIVYRRVKL